MIGLIAGHIIKKAPPLLLVQVYGLGYEVHAPLSVFAQTLGHGEAITLHTHYILREDGATLYGFLTERERDFFRLLIKISGVGPKMALSLLSSYSVNNLIEIVQLKKIDQLTAIPGIGKKTAERLWLELKDRLDKEFTYEAEAGIPTPSEGPILQDAISALQSLGYKPQDAKRAVSDAYQAGEPLDVLIRRALQHLAKGVMAE